MGLKYLNLSRPISWWGIKSCPISTPSPMWGGKNARGEKKGGAGQNSHLQSEPINPTKKNFNNQNPPIIASLHDHNSNQTKFAKTYPKNQSKSHPKKKKKKKKNQKSPKPTIFQKTHYLTTTTTSLTTSTGRAKGV